MAGGIEVADVFRRHGPAFRAARCDHLDRDQRRVMGAIEACRTAALGGHVRRCADCGRCETVTDLAAVRRFVAAERPAVRCEADRGGCGHVGQPREIRASGANTMLRNAGLDRD